jgi:hypothetical protein
MISPEFEKIKGFNFPYKICDNDNSSIHESYYFFSESKKSIENISLSCIIHKK